MWRPPCRAGPARLGTSVSMMAFGYAQATRKMALWEPGHPGEAFTELRLLPGQKSQTP